MSPGRPSEDLRGDRQLVLAAVGENGLALRHAAQALPGDGRGGLALAEIQRSIAAIACHSHHRHWEITWFNSWRAQLNGPSMSQSIADSTNYGK